MQILNVWTIRDIVTLRFNVAKNHVPFLSNGQKGHNLTD